ncbi:WXG100 family type VII secretion target [Mycobacterium sp.]|uniref:WXG100 family type VII secretion target n=1 Tax=Mycobacterium sp. TaxID=1785 RepID=UPI0025FE4E5B|nr:WXG100 family type VII secretion target [Mycobacterium sp.]
MAHDETVRVAPEAMSVAAQSLSSAAKDLRARLAELDGHIRDLLDGWQGGAGGAYGEAWNSWHRGAGEVQQGLSTLAKGIGVTGFEFDNLDCTSSQTVNGVYRG